MSKITFRADDDLVRRLEEEFNASKSEVMREALRAYLDAERTADPNPTPRAGGGTVDDALTERVDELIDRRLDERLSRFTPNAPQDVNVNVTVDGTSEETGDTAVADSTSSESRKTADTNDERAAKTERKTCGQCGENIDPDDVYCPNCGEKSSRRVFCECGDELRSDWAFCPSCGRRTPAADVLDHA